MPQHDDNAIDDDLPEAVLAEVADAAMGAAAERDARVAALCARHPEHAAGIAQMVAAITGTDRLLAQAFPPESVEMPATIGRYRVLRTLGEGAFGVVYLAAESQPVRREVAIKALRPGAGDRFTLQRFAAEQQLLASLDHPAIVRILEAGALPDGRPYFVMERIDGVPLTDHANARALTIEQRVRLFLTVCRGVHHAHARGVVHRDLKPANLLVAEVDGRPMPRIIDFGIAKVLAADDAARPFATDPGRMVGTPGYMSPEQRAGGSAPANVDARADVFALGVVLFELLVGERPWPGDAAAAADGPPRASAIARRRGAAGDEAVARRLRGDLDRILAKALQAEPAQRYADAGALADDLERHLDGRPVTAEAPSVARSVGRAWRRHKALWLAVAAVALVGGLGVGGVAYWQGQAEQADSRRVDEALRMAELLLRRASSPAANDGLDDAMRAELAADVVGVHDRLRAAASRPLSSAVQARALTASQFLAEAQHALGAFAEALALAQERLPDAEALVAAAPTLANRRLLAGHWREIGRSAFMLRRLDVARDATTKAVAAYAQIGADANDGFDGDHSKALLEHASALGATGDPAGQLAAIESAVAQLRQRVAAAADDESAVRDLVRSLSALANLWIRRKDATRAEATLEQAVAVVGNSRFALPEERARVCLRLARLRLQQGRFEAALAVATDARERLVPVIARQPNRHVERLVLLDVLAARAEASQLLGDAGAAASAAAELVDAASLGNAAAQRNAVDKLVGLARLRHEVGDRRGFAQAEAWLDAALRFLPDAGKDGKARCEVRLLRAMLAIQRGAVVDLRELEDLAQAIAVDEPAYVGWVQAVLAQRLLDDGQDERAAAALAAAAAAEPPAPAPWQARLRIRLATRRGDLAAARAAIEAAAADPGAGSEAMLGAFRLLPLAAPSADPDGLRAFVRRIAADFTATRGDGMAADESEELRLAQAQAVAIAACVDEQPGFDERQQRALAALRELRPRVSLANWDEALWFALELRQLAASVVAADPAAVAVAARELTPMLQERAQLLAVCDALARCMREDLAASDANAIDAVAAAALRRAIAAGLRRADVAARADVLDALGRGPDAAAAIAAIPE